MTVEQEKLPVSKFCTKDKNHENLSQECPACSRPPNQVGHPWPERTKNESLQPFVDAMMSSAIASATLQRGLNPENTVWDN